jgi:transmembrane sensor
VAVLIGGVIFLARRRQETHTDITRVYATAAQQQAFIELSDGTRVTLAPQTTLRLQHFGTQSRTVVLDGGEAYFEVAHTSGVPFVVRSGTATAQVLGTAFLVRYAARDSHVRVAVTDGKIRLMTSARVNPSVTLSAGQVGDATDSTTQMSTANDLAPGTEWAPGGIMFRHTPLAKVLQTVSWWYGYQFRYADQALAEQRVTIMVSTRSSAQALAAIEQVLAVNLAVVGDTITLMPQSSPSSQSVPRIRTYDVWTPTREVGR